MNPLHLPPWPVPPADLIERLGWCLLHLLWQGTAIAAGLALLLRFCRHGTPELRHALCGLALAAMAAAPVMTFPRIPAAPATSSFPPAQEFHPEEIQTNPGTISHPGSPQPESVPAFQYSNLPYGKTMESVDTPEFPLGNTSPPFPVTSNWVPWLGWFWLTGVALVAVWRVMGLFGMAWLIRSGGPAPETLRQQAAAMARRCGLRRPPSVRILLRMMSPAVAGVVRPVLLLPAAALAGLSPRELDFILAHEFAHIRRHDFLLGLFQTVVETLLFFHPAVWWISRHMNLEREHACDDAAMRVSGNRRAGASALARLAELQLEATFAPAPAAGGGHVLRRIRRLLEPPHFARSSHPVMSLPLLLLGLILIPFFFTPAESQDTTPTVDTDTAPATSDNKVTPAATPLMRGSITDRAGVILAESVQSTWVRNGAAISGEHRHYPLGAMASHVIGYTKQDVNGNAPEEGIAGVERSADAILRQSPAADGHSQPAVRLTLDARFQQICRKALIEAGVGRGSAVVLDVNNGDILATVSVPDFDLNQFAPFITSEAFDRLLVNPAIPLVNRAVSSYPPGSTFKLITALAAGKAGKWDRNYECTGAVKYDGRAFNCWTVQNAAAPHGIIALPEALRRSCNCYFYQLGNTIGIDGIEKMAKSFGIGEESFFRLGSPISDFMPDAGWWAKQNKGPWTASKTANISIGQGEVLATPLQMASVAAAIANGGRIWNPRILSQTLVNGTWQPAPLELRNDLAGEGVPSETITALRQGMFDAVHAASGATGKQSLSSLIAIAGKTGTSQQWRVDAITKKRMNDNHTQFVGFAPFEKPKYAFSVVVANGKSGGSVSAPIAKRILESIELLNRGELTVDLKPESPAAGHFNSLESVVYATELK